MVNKCFESTDKCRVEDTFSELPKKSTMTLPHEEGVSGTKEESDRPAFQEMIAEIPGDGVTTIIIEGMDRPAGEYRIRETLLIYLASKGISLITARTEPIVTDEVQADPMKKAPIQIQGILAELEKSLPAKKLRNARDKARAERGKYEGRRSYMEAAPEVIEQINKLRRKPKGGRRMTYVQVAEELNRKGFKTVSGKEFTGQTAQNIFFSL